MFIGNLKFSKHIESMKEVWIENVFHETHAKWYILEAYNLGLKVKGKFKPSPDLLFKYDQEIDLKYILCHIICISYVT